MEMQTVLKALSDKTRLKIIEMLLNKNYCVKALSRNLEISDSAVSQHLNILKDAGLIKGTKQGYYMHYTVNKQLLIELSQQLEKLANITRTLDANSKCGCMCNNKDKCK